MAYTVDILNALKVADNGLLSKINIGGKTYEIKDLIARENIGTLSAGLDAIAADLAALSYVKATGQFADDVAIKNYVDAQVGAINKFDVHVLLEGEELPVASEDTMYVLYLKPDTDAASGSYVEYITIQDDKAYKWEAIGSTKMDVTGFVTEEALNEALKSYAKSEDVVADIKEVTDGLGALAAKDSATGTVGSQTISGVKASGTTTGSINVELEQTSHTMESTGKYTPVGNISGTVKTAGSVAVTAKYAAENATLAKGDYTPEGDVSVALSGATFNAITGVGTQASFTEGTFTPASLTKEDVEANYVEEAIVGAVDGETLTFTAAATKALAATKVTAFNGGSKDADSFTANSLPTMVEQTVGVQSASFSGTKAEGALVTSVSYQKADIDTATFTGETVDIAATFAGTEGDVAVSGNCHDYAVKTADFTGAAIELNVGDIVVAEKTVTVE